MNAPAQFDDPTKLNWWQAALRGERRPIAEDPMTGYYRAKTKNKRTGEVTLHAVAYWWHNGKCFCKVGGGATLTGDQLQRWIERWPYVSKEPIKYDVYQAVVAGKPWPDQHVDEKAAPAESASKPLPEAADTSKAGEAGAADQPKQEAPAEPVDNTPQGILKRDIEAAKKGVSRYVEVEQGKAAIYKIDSDDMLNAAQELRSKLLALATKAKKAREEANRPHNDAIRANGKIWSPLEDEAQRMANWLRDGPMKAWQQHKLDQAAAAKKASETAGAPVPSNAPPPSAKIKGATGRSASAGTIKVALIEDQDKVYQFFREDEQLKAILQGLANGAVRAGIEVPGVTVKEEASIK